MSPGASKGAHTSFVPRIVAWELTRRCGLNCRHCRGNATSREYENELSTAECFDLLADIASFAKPIIILTGGEPMMRDDIYDIASYGTSQGLRMVMAPCGPLVTKETVSRMIESDIRRISLSLDGADRETHDSFRRSEGSFDSVIEASRAAREGGLEFQINTTITRHNYHQLDRILNLAVELGAVGFHPFLLVPTGRGKSLRGMEINPEEYEEVLIRIWEQSGRAPITIKPTCAPHYYRILRQKEREAGRKVTRETHGLNAMTKGCLGGQSFAFISHTGKVQICGFLDVEAGDIREESFATVWETSPLFLSIRDYGSYGGKCGSCDYIEVCGGCRARAYIRSGDYLAAEPYCTYVSSGEKGTDETAEFD